MRKLFLFSFIYQNSVSFEGNPGLLVFPWPCRLFPVCALRSPEMFTVTCHLFHVKNCCLIKANISSLAIELDSRFHFATICREMVIVLFLYLPVSYVRNHPLGLTLVSASYILHMIKICEGLDKQLISQKIYCVISHEDLSSDLRTDITSQPSCPTL